MGFQIIGPTAAQSAVGIGAQVKAFSIRVFEEVLREEVGRGFDRAPIIITDGVLRRDYRAVRNFGRIEARSKARANDVVVWLIHELERLSPIKTRRYQSSHKVLIDGQMYGWYNFDVDAEDRIDITGKRVVVVNTQPYAGKIEGKDAYTRWEVRGGKKSRRAARRRQGVQKNAMQGQSKQAPNGVYRVAIRNLQRRYGKSVFALFQPQKLPLGVRVMGYSNGRRKRILKDQIYPAIVIRVVE